VGVAIMSWPEGKCGRWWELWFVWYWRMHQ